MIIANFEDENYKRVTGLWQWDYGQVLRIQGLNLPNAVEIHFSLQESGGEAKKRVGFTKDGVTDVVIPESMLENEESLGSYDIFAFIYLTDDTSGQTEYKICMPVKARPKPEAFDKPEDEEIFREAIKAVNEAAERAEESERQAGEYAEQTKADAIKTGEDRTAIAEMVDSVSGIEQQVETVKEYKEQAQTAATNALLSEQKSNEAKEAARQAQTGAETAADEAEQHALEVAGDKVEVERLAAQVRQDKTSVEQTVQGFTSTAQQAIQSVQSAGTQAVGEVNTTKTDAVKAVQTEGTKQAEAVQAKGQEVINSIPSDYTTQMATKLDKQQSTENAGKALVIGEDGNVVPGEVQSGNGDYDLLVDTTITEQVASHIFELPKQCKDIIMFVILGTDGVRGDFRFKIFDDFFVTARDEYLYVKCESLNDSLKEVDGLSSDKTGLMYGKSITRRYVKPTSPIKTTDFVKTYHYFGLNAKVKIWGR